ncbi:MAG TPA: DUF4126 domain-containing protein [Longimicrobiales bacterium]|nr:DUF4126 domain-containing protein [Longimicrobiales bacterium]
MSASSLVVLGQILGLGFASGLNLYATVALLGIASRLALIPPLPVGLRGLESGIVILSAAALFLIELVVDKLEPVEWLWDVLHTLIRPVAAALLVYGALATHGLPVQLSGALAGGLVALAVHGSKAGLRVMLRASGASRSCWVASGVEDLLALLVAFAAVSHPSTALLVVGSALLLVALVGRRLWRASLLGLRALQARVAGFFGRTGWRGPGRLPAGLRRQIPDPPMGSAAPRAARATAAGLPGVAPWRNGWLVVSGTAPLFVYRTGLRARRVELPRAQGGSVRRAAWADALTVESEQGAYTLFLLKDGPSAEVVLEGLLRPATLSAA